jgi:hypothetical protein
MRSLHRTHLFAPARLDNGLAGVAGAVSGSLLPDADRPFSRPSGELPRRCRSRSRALRVPAGPPAAALDPDRASRVGVHAAPWGGWSGAARPRATHRQPRFRRNQGPDGG